MSEDLPFQLSHGKCIIQLEKLLLEENLLNGNWISEVEWLPTGGRGVIY